MSLGSRFWPCPFSHDLWAWSRASSGCSLSGAGALGTGCAGGRPDGSIHSKVGLPGGRIPGRDRRVDERVRGVR